MRGSEYDDFATVGITELAKVSAKGTIAEKVKAEFTCVLPGVTSDTIQEDLIYAKEPRLAIAMDLFVDSFKGQS